MFEEVKLAAALLGGLVCGLYDLKTSDMLDAVAWAMAALGILLHAYEGYVTGDWSVLLWCIFVVLAFSAFSLFMYRRGYWGGGDGELLVAYGALFPSGTDGSPLFPLLFLLSVFVVGAAYSVLYCLLQLFRSRELFRRLVLELKGCGRYLFFSAVALAGALASAVVFPPLSFPLLLSALLALYPPALCFSRFAEENLLRRKVPTSTLREGDALAEDVPEAGIKAVPVRGLSREEVERIREVRGCVAVIEGVRFAPVFPTALLFALFITANFK